MSVSVSLCVSLCVSVSVCVCVCVSVRSYGLERYHGGGQYFAWVKPGSLCEDFLPLDHDRSLHKEPMSAIR